MEYSTNENELILQTQAQRSSTEMFCRRNAPDANKNGIWIDAEQIFPELISDLLSDGHIIRFVAPGDSMYPTICDGDIVTVAPIKAASVSTGDIILYRHKSGLAAHRVLRIIKHCNEHSRSDPKDLKNRPSSETLHIILRGDAAVVFDEPVTAAQVLGRVTRVERQGRRIDPYSFKAIICFKARRIIARLKKSFRSKT